MGLSDGVHLLGFRVRDLCFWFRGCERPVVMRARAVSEANATLYKANDTSKGRVCLYALAY